MPRKVSFGDSLNSTCAPSDRPTTPEGQKSSGHEPKSTPSKARSTSEHSFRNGTTDEMRGVLIEDLVAIPEIEIDIFVDRLLPPLKEGIDIDDIISRLKADGSLIPGNTAADDRWKDFQSIPTSSGYHEDIVFNPLEQVGEKIAYYASQATGLQPTVTLKLDPRGVPRSHRGSNTRPDAYFLLKEAEDCSLAQETAQGKKMDRWWYDIALTGEVKRKTSTDDRDDNVRKMVFNLQQTMTLDACRRFTFGFTIEHKGMRLWLCSRAIVAVSTCFDFTTNVGLFTRILLCLIFATKEDLGWDPTIQAIGERHVDGTRNYRITVNEQTYETIQLLSEWAADEIISRASRVWRVVNVSTGETQILKDYWIEDDRDLEHDIRQRILCDVQKKFGPTIKGEVARYFLTPMNYWLVPINGEPDHTTKVMMRGYEPSFEKGFKLKVKKPRINEKKKSAGPAGATDPVAEIASGVKRKLNAPHPLCGGRTKLHHRRHYRVVFKEVAQPLNALLDLSKFFSALRDIAKVLKWIHESGWLHRDIGVSNLYSFGERGLLGDLEYAKRKDSDASHDVRSASPDCMPNEVIRKRFLYLPEEDEMDEILDREETDQKEVVQASASNDDPPFFDNEFHDLESLWWSAIYHLFFTRDKSELDLGNEVEMQDEKREEALCKVFPRSNMIEERRSFFDEKKMFEAGLAWMSARFDPIKRRLNNLRKHLFRKYSQFEADLSSTNTDVFRGCQELFIQLFDACRSFATGIELVPYKQTGPHYGQPDVNLNIEEQLGQLHLDDDDAANPPMPAILEPDYELDVEEK